jgi:hypothetical protein
VIQTFHTRCRFIFHVELYTANSQATRPSNTGMDLQTAIAFHILGARMDVETLLRPLQVPSNPMHTAMDPDASHLLSTHGTCVEGATYTNERIFRYRLAAPVVTLDSWFRSEWQRQALHFYETQSMCRQRNRTPSAISTTRSPSSVSL